MKKKLLFSLMLAFIALFVYHGATMGGITGKIAGVIIDAATGEPLPAVNVVIEGTTLGGATDNEGYYFIINIPPGTYSLQASMVGYTVESKTGIIVNVDHTTPVDFDLRVTAIAGEEVTVTAEREIVPMDISASQIVADAEQMVEVPMITDIAQYIHLQAGIEGDYIRGGGLDQTEFMMDGLMVVDNRQNKPMMMVNLSAVREMSIIKGGFNAEYGNVRSGLINVVTREGSPSVYHGSLDFRYRAAGLKHPGYSVFSPWNYYMRSYLDPAVAFVGTEHGTWTEAEKEQYKPFMGWNDYSEMLLADEDPNNDRTPEECRDMFMWLHRTEGSGALGQKEGKYGNKPDWFVDASFGGPIPSIGKYLGNLSFFASFRTNWEAFALPVYTDYFKENNAHLKLTSRLSQSMKLTVEGLYGETSSVAGSYNSPIMGGDAILNNSSAYAGDYFFSPAPMVPYFVYQSMQGVSFDHVLSPSTFYNIRISHVNTKNFANGPYKWRDTTPVRYFGPTPVDEAPYGYWYKTPPEQVVIAGSGANMRADERDWSKLNTVNVKFDLTSQIDRYNQIKIGLMYNYDDILEHYAKVDDFCPGDSWSVKWRQYPYRAGVYLQDKLEFEGMIANLGVRLDWNEPNCDWYTVDVYSQYFSKPFMAVFTEVTPKEPAKGHLKISPRLGVSHPISENAKLYFNYGHFYSMAPSDDMYLIRYGSQASGITFIGNPSADLPQTVAYELGVEYNVRDMFLIHLSGYYKDVRNQTGNIGYRSYDGTVNYSTVENNNYADIRGFELRLDKRFGRWVTGWVNYNYMVQTSGYIGRRQYYEDIRQQALYGLQNPYQERPLARPVARANLNVRSPRNWGPTVAGINPLSQIQIGLLADWKAGRYETYDPLETYELNQNLQWKSNYNVDLRLSKRGQVGKYNISLFIDVNNVFNIKTLREQGFAPDDLDRKYYLKSLHLPMYAGSTPEEAAEYKNLGYIAGDDKAGDIKSDDKPYINMPNIDHLTFIDMRVIYWGLRIDF